MKEELKNPVWSALSETHNCFKVDCEFGKFYHPDICNFGAFFKDELTSLAIDNYGKIANDLFIVGGESPTFNKDNINLEREVLCNQMILKDLKEPLYKDIIVKLNSSHMKQVYNLVWLVMPGYYKEKTFNLGDYYGIFKENTLVAVTGERLQSNLFIEISAVVTHPLHTGKGYAKQLVAYATKVILEKSKTPILHVAENNTIAIKLYEKLGFKKLQKITWRNYKLKIK